jgi:hypothetical protein
MRATWESHPNSDYMSLHLDRLVPKYSRYGSADKPEPGAELAERIMQIPGVNDVSLGVLNRYEISITRGKVFDWDEIMPSVEHIVRDHLYGEDTPAA